MSNDRPHRSELLGRSSEREVLEALVRDIRQGESRSLVVRGEAGIGKTALLEDLVDLASDLTVLRATGLESEMELAFASLHQLCAPMLGRLEALPAPQRDALQVVFGVNAGPPPDRFLVGLAVLSLFSEVAEERPLLCIVDDAQWLDQVSALTLAFVARRLLADPVGIVFAAREPGNELQDLPDLEVTGLRNGEARALLGSAVRFRLDDRVCDRIVAETRGNPLAVLELGRGMTATQLAGGFGIPATAGLPRRIEESFIRRLERLPHDTRRLLVVASAEPTGNPDLLWRAADRLGIDRSAAVPAEADGLVEFGRWVQFRHPLVRSAVYRSAFVADRSAAHQALAEVTDPELDYDRRAWHLAAAATGPDENVAEELESSAMRVEARGGTAAAAAFLARAVELTDDPRLRARRALAAGLASLKAGDFDAALQSLRTAEAGQLDALGRAHVDLLRGELAFASRAGADAPPLLLKAAQQLEPADPALARQTYLEAWVASMFAGRFGGGDQMREISRAARSAPAPATSPRPSDLLLDGLATMVTEGRGAAVPTLSRVARVFADGAVGAEEKPLWEWTAAIAPIMLWDDERWDAIAARQLEAVREAGLLHHLPIYAHGSAIVVIWHGDLATAGSLIEEANAIAKATGTHVAPYAAVMLAAYRGARDDASGLIEAVIRNARASHQGLAIQWCQFVSATLHNGLGEYEKALQLAEEASQQAPELYNSMQALPELIEAATRSGKMALATDAFARLTEATTGSDTGWALGVKALSRALVSERDEAESAYREAIDRFGRTRLRPGFARAHLLYGEWLRRENRRHDARAALRTANDLFVTIGMEAFAERARRELVATGEKVRKRTVETRDDLTPQERQIARLAREGLSNPEIGARLFVSPRTVEWHLRNVFTKLGIRSRGELAAALPAAERTEVPT